MAHLNTRKLFSSPWGFPNLLFPLLRSYSFPSSLFFFFCPTLFSLCLLGQQEWGLQNCCAKLEAAEPGVREKYKLSSHAKWTHQELSPAVVLSRLLSSRQNYLQGGADNNAFTCLAMQGISESALSSNSAGLMPAMFDRFKTDTRSSFPRREECNCKWFSIFKWVVLPYCQKTPTM